MDSAMEGEHTNMRSIFNSVFPIFVENDESNIRSHPENLIRAIMITGSIHALNTELLFQAAVNQSSIGERTLFISQTPLTQLPTPVHGMPTPLSINMNFMTLVYIDDLQNLVKFLSTFHIEWIAIPLLIVIDNLDHYIEQMKDHARLEQRCVRLCALLQETTKFCAQKRQCRAGLFLGCKRNTNCVKLFHVFSHFFHTIWNITRNTELDSTNCTSFTIMELSGGNAKNEKLLLYKKANAIYVESIHFLSSSNNSDIT